MKRRISILTRYSDELDWRKSSVDPLDEDLDADTVVGIVPGQADQVRAPRSLEFVDSLVLDSTNSSERRHASTAQPI
jgi:hypothetical protein